MRRVTGDVGSEETAPDWLQSQFRIIGEVTLVLGVGV
jgi:hypothetical protein